AELHRRTGNEPFDVALVLGSGWKEAGRAMGEPTAELDATDLPGFLPPAVEGHEGRIQAVERNGQRVLAYLGRSHLYEDRGVVARGVDPSLKEGVYAHWPGPAFETPAEIRMLRTLSADLVGMSTVPEAIAAHALGAEVLALSLVTNLADGLGDEKLSHLDVIAQGEAAADRCAALLARVLDQIGGPSSSGDSTA